MNVTEKPEKLNNVLKATVEQLQTSNIVHSYYYHTRSMRPIELNQWYRVFSHSSRSRVEIQYGS